MRNSIVKVSLQVAPLAWILTSCGSPSPWANVARFGMVNLTEKHIDKLGEGSDKSDGFSIGLIADQQVMSGHFKKVVDALDEREDIDFYLVLGDLTDRSLRQEFEWVAGIIEDARRPTLTVVGNHDGLLHGERIYKDMFGKLNYSFRYGSTKFVLWNNNPFEWGYPDFDWLENEISDEDRVIIASHQPPGKIERYDDANDRFEDILNREQVIASFHGHTHKFNLDYFSSSPVFTVGRVENTKYGIARITPGAVTVECCEGGECWQVD